LLKELEGEEYEKFWKEYSINIKMGVRRTLATAFVLLNFYASTHPTINVTNTPCVFVASMLRWTENTRWYKIWWSSADLILQSYLKKFSNKRDRKQNDFLLM
jgi:hypothetical protein